VAYKDGKKQKSYLQQPQEGEHYSLHIVSKGYRWRFRCISKVSQFWKICFAAENKQSFSTLIGTDVLSCALVKNKDKGKKKDEKRDEKSLVKTALGAYFTESSTSSGKREYF